MNEAERRLTEDRGNRKAARGLFKRRLAQVKADYQARGIGERMKAKATDEGAKALAYGVDVAKESKGIIALASGALLLWFFRNPALNLARRLIDRRQDSVQEDADSGATEAEENSQ